MTNKNTESTRYWSDIQEKSVCKKLDCIQTSNSGAGKFDKSDVYSKDASLSIECKTSMTDKDSFSIKKEWFIKHKQEAYSTGFQNTAIAIRFGPTQEDYYIIDEAMMRFLVDKLIEDNANL